MAQSQFQRVVQEAERLDARRRTQIENQKNAITRMLAKIAELESKLAEARPVIIDDLSGLQAEIANGTLLLGPNEAERMEMDMGKRRDAFEAGYEAGTVAKAKRLDVDEAFDQYKDQLAVDAVVADDENEDTNAAE